MLDILRGVRVIEHGTYITGPCASMLLGDMGADVIKVELPGKGDPFRAYRGELYSPHYQSFGRNKRSVTLDVRKTDDRADFDELIRDADVYIQNFRPGFADMLGIGPAALSAINPRLVYCSISGFGPSGPYRDRPCFDGVAQGMGGFMRLMIDRERPRVMGPAIADTMTGTYAALGIMAALHARSDSAAGAVLDISMLEAMAYFNIDDFTHYFSAGEIMDPYSRPRVSQAHVLRCADDGWICLHLSSPEKFWEGLVRVIDQPELLSDPRFADRAGRIDNAEALILILRDTFIGQPRAYWVARLEAEEVPFSPLYDSSELQHDPQAQHLELFVEGQHPKRGSFRTVRFPVTFDGKRAESVVPPPELGEHNEEILNSLRPPSRAVAPLEGEA
jgi:crotonobetainyl-CoA:carnitine CoA-transferase CaiB-like acyl-CoA transferase